MKNEYGLPRAIKTDTGLTYGEFSFTERDDGYKYGIRDVGEHGTLLQVVVESPEQNLYWCYLHQGEISVDWRADRYSFQCGDSRIMAPQANAEVKIAEQIASDEFARVGWTGYKPS